MRIPRHPHRPVIYGNSLDRFYSSLSDEKKISLKRDVPNYPKVILSEKKNNERRQWTSLAALFRHEIPVDSCTAVVLEYITERLSVYKSILCIDGRIAPPAGCFLDCILPFPFPCLCQRLGYSNMLY